MGCARFVKKLSVNGGQLPTYSLIPPDLHRKIFFCTFATVKKCPHSDTPTPKGSGLCSTNNAYSIMAKSKAGGSRAYIRGRIGSDVYSIGKDGKGQRQQVVRSLAEAVANPRSQSQMFGRMIMSTVMQAVSAMSEIIDHSFDGTAKGQPSISEFIRQNYSLIKADATAHPSGNNNFALAAYQEKGAKCGKYVISKGSAVAPSALETSDESCFVRLTAETLTVGGLKAALGLSGEDFITTCFIDTKGVFAFVRLKLTGTAPDSTALTPEVLASLFTVEGNATPTWFVNSNLAGFTVSGLYTSSSICSGVILSKKEDGAWIHSDCVLSNDSAIGLDYADNVLPTYPIGSEAFLNGGDL